MSDLTVHGVWIDKKTDTRTRPCGADNGSASWNWDNVNCEDCKRVFAEAKRFINRARR